MKNKNIKKLKKQKMKKTKKTKTGIHFFSAMQTQIEGYGFSYSLSGFIKQMLLFLGAIILLAYFFHLQLTYIAILVIATLITMPILVVNQFKFIYEQNRFNDLTIYLEQMAYSFKKRPKILTALEDTYEVTSGKMKKLVGQAIATIEYGYSDENLYKEALANIEKEYACSRLLSLHKFLIKVEENGGEYHNSMDILIQDSSEWAKRTYVFQKDRKTIKMRIIISIILALVVTGFMGNVVPSKFSFIGNPVYQMTTLGLFIIFLAVYAVAQSKLNGSWLENDAIKNNKLIVRDYQRVFHQASAKEMKKQKMQIAILVPGVILALVIKQIPILITILFLMYFIYIQPKNKAKLARTKTVREITKEVPGWCREIALNLQTENVYMAIANTQEDCPIVLREPVRKLLDEIDEHPNSVVPFNNFLSEFNIPEIARMMKTLYSLTEYGVQDAESQINKIVEQNNVMLGKAETMKNEDNIAIISFVAYLPMVLGALKMGVDILLLTGAFTTFTSI